MPDPKGIVLSNQANNTVGKHIHNYSSFDESLSYRFANTLRFGDYTPSFDMEGVERDEVSVNTLDRIDSLSLKAPFKGSIRKIKESFKVPNMAILPMQWDRIYAQPSNGDDVPSDANCIINTWLSHCKALWSNAYDIVRAKLVAWSSSTTGVTSSDIQIFYTALLRTMVLGEYMFSAGSLLHVSGYRYGAQFFRFPKQAQISTSPIAYGTFEEITYDAWFDMCCHNFFDHVRDIWVSIPNSSGYYKIRCLDDQYPAPAGYLAFRSLLELFRENPMLSVSQVYYDNRYSDAPSLASYLAGQSDGLGCFYKSAANLSWHEVAVHPESDDITELNPHVLNLSRVLAYQLVCAHFYTNSSIDWIYSAELYREYVFSLFRKSLSNPPTNVMTNFSWNGHNLQYDYLSGHILEQLLFYDGLNYHTNIDAWLSDISVLGHDGSLASRNPYLMVFPAWAAIFGFRKSLRYGDYFTGSRPRPLAPINTDVSVNNNAVSVVDITRNIQAQRFANAVMRSRSKVEEYVKSLFGKAPAPDFHNPFFLARQTEQIFGDEVQNTGAVQVSDAQSRTSNFASNVGQYTFTFHNDDMHPCIYLQIISFDIRRAYTRSVDRQMLHIDRFDMFNPDFQYIGDQPVYGVELGYLDYQGSVPDVFSYQSRDMEFKQRFDVASSGFIENLPGWILTDVDRSRIVTANLNPDFIRSYNTELDQFFLSLTGYSLANYFHFICITSNNVSAKRAMAVDPQILA